jgi:hypothetical protein
MMHSMSSFALGQRRIFGKRVKDVPALVASTLGADESAYGPLRIVTWVAGGFAVLALGLMAGLELRHRYKFNRRTPYDLYAHSGDEVQDMEYSVGI